MFEGEGNIFMDLDEVHAVIENVQTSQHWIYIARVGRFLLDYHRTFRFFSFCLIGYGCQEKKRKLYPSFFCHDISIIFFG